MSPSILQSISIRAWEQLRGIAGEATLLSQFARAANIMVADHLIALVLPEIGNGPFHVVIDVLPGYALPRHLPLTWESHQLWLGPWCIQSQAAPVFWNPRVAWEQLSFDPRAQSELRAFVEMAAQSRGVWQDGVVLGGAAAKKRVSPLATLDAAAKNGDADAFLVAAVALAGWGPGLTPSGDDFLAGLMLSLWAQYGERARPWCTQMAAAALPRTTRLSRAFLQAAANGLADARWHTLLHALTGAPGVTLEQAVREVLAFGATSGLDMLAGFLYGDLKALLLNCWLR
ncbi:MAG: DUF2877 domain-containing protein [Anaerolineae bacterium]|nr:DUF2877 domain-containing protein [Anaerolineae bacterium]